MPTFTQASTVGIEEQAGNGTRWVDITLTSFLTSATCFPSTLGLSRFVGTPIGSMAERAVATSHYPFDVRLSGMYLRVVGATAVANPMTINIHVLGAL